MKQMFVLLGVIGLVKTCCSELSNGAKTVEDELQRLESQLSLNADQSHGLKPPLQRQLVCTLYDFEDRVEPINVFGIRYYDNLVLEAREVYEMSFPKCSLAQLLAFEKTGCAVGFNLTGERESWYNLGDVIGRLIHSRVVTTCQMNLSHAHCEKSIIHNENLQGADLSYVHFDQAILHSSNLNGANLKNASLRCADLSSVKFNKVNAINADFSGANLSCAEFNGADVTGAIFAGARILLGDLERGKFDGAIGLDLTGAIIVGRRGQDDVICEKSTYSYLKTEKQ